MTSFQFINNYDIIIVNIQVALGYIDESIELEMIKFAFKFYFNRPIKKVYNRSHCFIPSTKLIINLDSIIGLLQPPVDCRIQFPMNSEKKKKKLNLFIVSIRLKRAALSLSLSISISFPFSPLNLIINHNLTVIPTDLSAHTCFLHVWIWGEGVGVGRRISRVGSKVETWGK